MGVEFDLAPAGERLGKIAAAIRDHQLTAPTPCTAYRVGDLLDHVMGLTVVFRDAALKARTPADRGSPSLATLDPQWRAELPRRLAALVDAWHDPAAWEGEATVAGVTMPGAVTATVALDELVLHGWDLARATGQDYGPDPVSAEVVLRYTQMMAEPTEAAGRDGLFGPVVPVPDGAPVFQRALGLSGRDPSWAA